MLRNKNKLYLSILNKKKWERKKIKTLHYNDEFI